MEEVEKELRSLLRAAALWVGHAHHRVVQGQNDLALTCIVKAQGILHEIADLEKQR